MSELNVIPSAPGMARHNAMKRALLECQAVDEVKELRDQAIAMETYARQAMDFEAERIAIDIRIRAERRAGDLMRVMQKSKGGRPAKNSSHDGDSLSEFAQAKESADISDRQAERWQQLSKIPDEEFEDKMMGRDKITTSGLIESQKKKPPMDKRAIWLWGRLRDYNREGAYDFDLPYLINELSDSMRDNLFFEAKRVRDLMNLILENEND